MDKFRNADNPDATISRYSGMLLLRIRPNEKSLLSIALISLTKYIFVGLDSEQDFDNVKKDEERWKFLHLKEQSIKVTGLIQAIKNLKKLKH